MQPTIFVLFGATGDLARRLVLPAFAALAVVAVLLAELAQADTVRAKAARPAAPHIFRIGIISPSQCA